jgi:cyclic pyranopterin phosphate synthase
MSLSHVDERGQARMVDVGEKPVTRREAVIRGWVRMKPETLAFIQADGLPKTQRRLHWSVVEMRK